MMFPNRIASTPARKGSIAWLAGAGLFLSAMMLMLHLPLGASPPTPIADKTIRQTSELGVREAGETNAPDVASVPGTSDAWWANVQAELERGEYETSTTQHGLQAPNRAHNLRTTFGERGIEVVPRTGKDVSPGWRFA